MGKRRKQSRMSLAPLYTNVFVAGISVPVKLLNASLILWNHISDFISLSRLWHRRHTQKNIFSCRT